MPASPATPTYAALAKRLLTSRRFIAWIAHAPGLWAVYGEVLPKPMQRANLIAVVATVVAVGSVCALVCRPYRLVTALIVWVMCHVTWGSYLAWHLPPSSRD
jgi:hypothetical protein